MDSDPEMEKQQNNFAPPLNPKEVMSGLKELRKSYQDETETAANSAKTATFEKKCSQISHYSQVFEFEDQVELQFLREERAAIREYDAGMQRNRAEYLSVLDVPIIPA